MLVYHRLLQPQPTIADVTADKTKRFGITGSEVRTTAWFQSCISVQTIRDSAWLVVQYRPLLGVEYRRARFLVINHSSQSNDVDNIFVRHQLRRQCYTEDRHCRCRLYAITGASWSQIIHRINWTSTIIYILIAINYRVTVIRRRHIFTPLQVLTI